MMRLLLIPPDTRPPTLDFPLNLAKAVGMDVAVPPPEALNHLNQPGDLNVLQTWLLDAPPADVLIVSLETLCLGGLIPARRVTTTLEEAVARLHLLERLKAQQPNLRIFASGVIVRVAHDDDPLEEKSYYGEHGAALRAYSEAFDRYERRGAQEDARALEGAKAGVPAHVLEDWLRTRRRNHALHLEALELVADGVIHHLCLTLDDTSTYGLAAHDRRALEAKTDALGLWPKVDIYPGADEVPVTLLARVVQEEAQARTKVYVRYSSTLGAAAELLYEDRPAGELVRAHLRAAGCREVEALADADTVLAVNTPALKQAETQPDHATVDTPARHLPAFVDFIEACLGQKPVTLADIAYPNGAERRLMTLLDRLPLSKLAGFSAWNTAGNSLGSAVALGVLSSRVENRVLWTEILFNRLVDDYLYQSVVRGEVWQRLDNPSPFDLGVQKRKAENMTGEQLEPLAHDLWQKHFTETGLRLEWHPPTLAWPRLFTGVFPFQIESEGERDA